MSANPARRERNLDEMMEGLETSSKEDVNVLWSVGENALCQSNSENTVLWSLSQEKEQELKINSRLKPHLAAHMEPQR